MTDADEFPNGYRNPYWYMRVYWWDGWGMVGFWLWTVLMVALGAWWFR